MRCVWEECHLGCYSALRPYCGEDCILLSSKRAAERAVGWHEEKSVGCNTWKSNLLFGSTSAAEIGRQRTQPLPYHECPDTPYFSGHVSGIKVCSTIE